MGMFDPLGKFKKLFTDINVPFPSSPQPIKFWRALGIADETIANLQGQWIRRRHGPQLKYVVNLTNVVRIMEFTTGDLTKLFVPISQHLRAEVVVIHPTLGMYNVPISLRSGEQWTKARQDRLIASALKRVDPKLENTSRIVQQSIVKINWYLTSYAANVQEQ